MGFGVGEGGKGGEAGRLECMAVDSFGSPHVDVTLGGPLVGSALLLPCQFQ